MMRLQHAYMEDGIDIELRQKFKLVVDLAYFLNHGEWPFILVHQPLMNLPQGL